MVEDLSRIAIEINLDIIFAFSHIYHSIVFEYSTLVQRCICNSNKVLALDNQQSAQHNTLPKQSLKLNKPESSQTPMEHKY